MDARDGGAPTFPISTAQPTALSRDQPNHAALDRKDERVRNAVEEEPPARGDQSDAEHSRLLDCPLERPQEKEARDRRGSVLAGEHGAEADAHEGERQIVREYQREDASYLLHPRRPVRFRISIFPGGP